MTDNVNAAPGINQGGSSNHFPAGPQVCCVGGAIRPALPSGLSSVSSVSLRVQRSWDQAGGGTPGCPFIALMSGSGLMGMLPRIQLGRPVREGHRSCSGTCQMGLRRLGRHFSVCIPLSHVPGAFKDETLS